MEWTGNCPRTFAGGCRRRKLVRSSATECFLCSRVVRVMAGSVTWRWRSRMAEMVFQAGRSRPWTGFVRGRDRDVSRWWLSALLMLMFDRPTGWLDGVLEAAVSKLVNAAKGITPHRGGAAAEGGGGGAESGECRGAAASSIGCARSRRIGHLVSYLVSTWCSVDSNSAAGGR